MNPATNTQPNIMPMYPGIHQTDEVEAEAKKHFKDGVAKGW